MAFDRITLYHHPATRSARVKWLLHELYGDAFDTKLVRLYEGEQFHPDFLALNPSHAVPTVVLRATDGRETTMIESGAIVTLLADLHPEEGLAPPPTPFSPERADYLQMIHFCGAAIDMMLWQVRIHLHVLPESARHQATAARYRAKFADEVEPRLIRRLDAAAFVCGDTFSAADCMYGHALLWARSYGLCADAAFRAYLSRVTKRPAFAKAYADARDFKPEVPDGSGLRAQFSG